jgi:hypothetical protein
MIDRVPLQALAHGQCIKTWPDLTPQDLCRCGNMIGLRREKLSIVNKLKWRIYCVWRGNSGRSGTEYSEYLGTYLSSADVRWTVLD